MTLDAHVVARRPGFVLDLALTVERGETVALVGPNGAGKSTFLHAIAGLVGLARGHVRVGGRVLDDVAAGVRLPAERRRCGLVFQHHLLFPHLTAIENVAFGLRAQGVDPNEARCRARAWLERLDAVGVAYQAGGRLSGGQAQRVALARALACEPEVLLLDEPFAALDAFSRPRVHRMLRESVLGGSRPAILVTHDPSDARALADRVVPLAFGRAAAQDAGADAAAVAAFRRG